MVREYMESDFLSCRLNSVYRSNQDHILKNSILHVCTIVIEINTSIIVIRAYRNLIKANKKKFYSMGLYACGLSRIKIRN